MATERQKRAVDKIVENGGNVSRAMREAKYSPQTAKTPQKLTESKGFKELCEELGLTDNFLTSCLVEDIKKKKQNRKPELELGFKIKGLLTEKIDHTTGGEKITPIYGGTSICQKENIKEQKNNENMLEQ